MISRIGALCALLALSFPSLGAAIPNGWFEWPLREPADGSALDASRLNHKPAGALGRITVKDGRFVTADGTALRFWGCNLSGQDAFPDAATAESFARLLAKSGINIARLHHMDNPWGKSDGGSIWPRGDKHEALDAAQLDRMHRLVAELKRNGVYTNLNLKVSKTLTAADGFPSSVGEIPNFQKRVDMFQRRMIELQKDYARRILTPKNPYTGLSLAEDPAVAVIEMNNENSLLGFWTRDLGRGLDAIPEPFRTELTGLWNAWLKRNYRDDKSLAAAWAGGPTAKVESFDLAAKWSAESKQGAKLELRQGEDATGLELHIQTATGVDWHAQAHLNGLQLKDGEVYTLDFEARASAQRRIQSGVGIDSIAQPEDGWRSFGLLDQVDVGTEWKRIRQSFCAHSVSGAPGRLSFNVGQQQGTVWIRNLRLLSGSDGAGLQTAQSMDAGSVPIPVQASSAQWADWIHFLADTERGFAMEMRAFLKDELKVMAPMLCTQVDYSGLTGMWREKDMEFADSHTYWQHPDFPGGGMWDKDAWTIRNSPQVAELRDRSFGELGAMAMIRVAGKPFTLSEYDHAAPSEYACEMYPILSSFGSRQDWDGIYPFCIGSTKKSDKGGAIDGYFDQQHHPAKWAFSSFATRVFRQSLVGPAGLSAELQLGDPFWGESHHADVLWRKFTPKGSLGFLSTRIGVSPINLPRGESARVLRRGSPDLGPVALIQAAKGPVWIVSANKAAAAVGYLGGARIKAGAMTVETSEFGLNFASVTAVTLDDRTMEESKRILVTLAARAQNQDIVWNEARTSIGSHWGKGPPVSERVPATIQLECAQNRVVYSLSPDGSRLGKVESKHQAGVLTFTVAPDDRTMHYEVTAD